MLWDTNACEQHVELSQYKCRKCSMQICVAVHRQWRASSHRATCEQEIFSGVLHSHTVIESTKHDSGLNQLMDSVQPCYNLLDQRHCLGHIYTHETTDAMYMQMWS